jgi:deazaflavin-dependent oxidoreductase (nitroreductase family)
VAKGYRKTRLAGIRDRMLTRMLRRGKGPPDIWLITVPGRRSGRPYTTPVSPVEDGGARWLVAPYGEVAWVRNVRAAGRLTLTRGERSEEVRADEVAPAEAAPVLRRYLAANRLIKRYFDATAGSSDDDLRAEAARHPVFRLTPV